MKITGKPLLTSLDSALWNVKRESISFQGLTRTQRRRAEARTLRTRDNQNSLGGYLNSRGGVVSSAYMCVYASESTLVPLPEMSHTLASRPGGSRLGILSRNGMYIGFGHG